MRLSKRTDIALDTAAAFQLYRAMCTTRTIDTVERGLVKRGGGLLHVGSHGAELNAVIALFLTELDEAFLHWRDRALRIALGLSVEAIARSFFAVAGGEGDDKNLTGHESSKLLNIHPVSTPTPSQCLAAIGVAMSVYSEKSQAIVICSLGDGASQQGEFAEAWMASLRDRLPILWVIIDNGWAISTPTDGLTAIDLGIVQSNRIAMIESSKPSEAFQTIAASINRVRSGDGPLVLHHKCPRLAGHTSNDFETVYRSQINRELDQARDPVDAMRKLLLQDFGIAEKSLQEFELTITKECQAAYELVAKTAESPNAALQSKGHFTFNQDLDSTKSSTIAEQIRISLAEILELHSDAILLGEDIADPQGGVFRLIRVLSTRFPERVRNSALSEATILGAAFGYATTGKLAIAEIQFIDFLAPAWNQLTTNITPLAWRTDGKWTAPVIMYAPAGGYTPGAGMFHSQVNSSILARLEGLIVGFPSNPDDARLMLFNAAIHDGPTFLLLPKALLFASQAFNGQKGLSNEPYRAAIILPGTDITIATWGHGVAICRQAIEQFGEGIVELIDMRYLNPLDIETLTKSIKRTNHLIVLDEDWRVCSVGSEIIARVLQDPETFDVLKRSPVLLSRQEQFLARTSGHECTCLPQVDDVVFAVRQLLDWDRS